MILTKILSKSEIGTGLTICQELPCCYTILTLKSLIKGEDKKLEFALGDDDIDLILSVLNYIKNQKRK